MMAGLASLVYRTPLGTAMRATAQNPQVAGLMGIDVNRVIAVTFVIGAALGAVAGVHGRHLLRHRALHHGLDARPEGVLARRCWAASATSRARCSAACCSALVEALGAGYIGDFTDLCQLGGSAGCSRRCAGGGHFILFGRNYQDVFAFIVLILVLVFRPQGLLGERVGDRA